MINFKKKFHFLKVHIFKGDFFERVGGFSKILRIRVGHGKCLRLLARWAEKRPKNAYVLFE